MIFILEIYFDPDKAVKYGSDSVAHWITQPTHFEERFKLIKLYQTKGWKTIYQ